LEYSPLENTQYYGESRALVTALGFELLDLKIARSGGNTRVSVVIAGKTAAQSIGTDDCAKIHRALKDRFEARLETDDFYMEVSSPGSERLIKNAAEFPLFAERAARFWDTRSSSWIEGIIKEGTPESVTIQLKETNGEPGLLAIPLAAIAKAKLL
jgi:ribosome maturation factor RimP